MLATLILLYALNALADVPTGCFIAAWVFVILKTIVTILQHIMKAKIDKWKKQLKNKTVF